MCELTKKRKEKNKKNRDHMFPPFPPTMLIWLVTFLGAFCYLNWEKRRKNSLLFLFSFKYLGSVHFALGEGFFHEFDQDWRYGFVGGPNGDAVELEEKRDLSR